MMRPRVILLADGASGAYHLPINRLLTPIQGKPLLKRTIQQFGEWADIALLSSDPTIRKAVRPQKSFQYVTAKDKSRFYYGIDMIRKGLEHASNRRSIVVFGDVVFTDEAVEIIRQNEVDDWALYGRRTDNKITKTPWGEPFAVEVSWSSRLRMKQAVREVSKLYQEGKTKRCTVWEWYYHMEGMPLNVGNPSNCNIGPHWVEINDATDDIDFASDLENILRVWNG